MQKFRELIKPDLVLMEALGTALQVFVHVVLEFRGSQSVEREGTLLAIISGFQSSQLEPESLVLGIE